ncbi:MAG: ABC transporter ATP-binding protein [Chloroflexota bacterium]
MMGDYLDIRIDAAGYGSYPVLRNVEIGVRSGESVTILGANGAGKSTLVRAVSGLIRFNGSVLLNDEELSGLRPDVIVQRGIIQVPEGRGTIGSLTVYENLMVGAYRRKGRALVNRDVDWVYSLFPILRERRHQQAGSLSGGEQQMLAIGRALMGAPKMFILDEPSFGLAPLVVRDIFDTLRFIKLKRTLGILLVEQNAMVALSISDFGHVLEEGTTRISGTGAELLKSETVINAYMDGELGGAK